MDEGDPVPDAADHPVQDIQWTELGGNGDANEMQGWRRDNSKRSTEIFEEKLKVVRFVPDCPVLKCYSIC